MSDQHQRYCLAFELPQRVRRWRARAGTVRTFTPLSLLQLGSLACLPAIVAALAVLHRHLTANVFLPAWDYVFSLQIAFPPVVLFVAGYILAFLTGTHLSDVPREVIRYLRNRYLQSMRAMLAGIVATVLLLAGTLWYVSAVPAPKYEDLVHAILRGEADDFADAERATEAVKAVNPELASRYQLVLETFVERARVNLSAGQVNTARARLLVRSLSVEGDSGWADHPLRWHALAEAYSLLAGAIRNSERAGGASAAFGDLSSDNLSARGAELYQAVARSRDVRALPLMRASALNNVGNAYLYQDRVEEALVAWREANSEMLGFRNTSSWGNIIAGLVILGRYSEAISEGEQAREWAESTGKALQEASQYVSIVVNTAFARMADGDFDGAIAGFQLADALQNDNNTRLNLALSYALQGSYGRAQEVLRTVGAPVTVSTQAVTAISTEEVRCAQLIWFLAEPDADLATKVARLTAFRGQAFSTAELSQSTEEQLIALRTQTADWLSEFPGSCATFAHIEAIVEAIRG